MICEQAFLFSFQAKLVNTSNRTILVMTSQKGIQMFEADMSLMLYWYSLGDMSHGDGNKHTRTATG